MRKLNCFKKKLVFDGIAHKNENNRLFHLFSIVYNLRLTTKLFICITIICFIIFYSSLEYSTYYYLVKQDRFIPQVIDEDGVLVLKSNCKCKPNPIKVVKQKNIYSISFNTRHSSVKYNLSQSEFNLGEVTCDLYNVLLRKPKQKVIGLSLYGKDEYYYKQIKQISKFVKKFYPGWIIRINYDSTINKSVICEFECLNRKIEDNNIDFCNVEKLPYGSENQLWDATYMHKMTWRWLPIGDPFVDFYMSRDSDSWIIEREAKSVEVWLNSSTLFHIMRDHPQHNVPMLGGMWGLKVKQNRKVANELFTILVNKKIAQKYNPKKISKKGLDQFFLNDYVWKSAKKSATIHDSYSCSEFGGEPFPTRRPSYMCFVACNNCCNTSYNNKTNEICPDKCKPNGHGDWIYC